MTVREQGSDWLPHEWKDLIDQEVRPDEEVLWCGRRVVVNYPLALTLIPSLFGVVFAGFAAVWIVMALSVSGESQGMGVSSCVFPLFGLPFLAIGVAMATSPIWVRRRLLRSFYALTSKRAILWQSRVFGRRVVRSLRPRDIRRIEVREYDSGTGDLFFMQGGRDRPPNQAAVWDAFLGIGFLGIEEVRDAERLVRKHLLEEQVE